MTSRVILRAKHEGSHKLIYEIATPAFGGLAMTVVFLLFLTAGCTKEKRSSESSNPLTGPPGASNLASLQSDIFALGCATSGCHDNRATPAGNLNMSSSAKTHSNLVNRNSTQASGVKLVVPNDPGASYLIDKLQGTHLAVGGSGVRMPQYAAPLSTEEFDRIVTWINSGAPLN